VSATLVAWFAERRTPADELERFLGEALHAAGVWSSPRDSDGVHARAFDALADGGLQVRGQIWTVEDQVLHSVWLVFEPVAESAGKLRWTLYFDVDAPSPRKRRDAWDLAARPEDITWHTTIHGVAIHDADGLTRDEAQVRSPDESCAWPGR
jgi:hypothetical protein